MWAKTNKRGFTIVELLIVIVVIGILAAITIVAYTGISNRATAASLQSDLTNAGKLLRADQVINSVFPVSLAAVNGGSGVKASPGTTFQYQFSNTDPQTFCVTATKSGQTYSINQDGSPVSGGCLITNLIANPSFELNTWTLAGPNNTAARSSLQAYTGTSSALVTHSSGTNGNGYYAYANSNLTIGAQYTVSFWTRLGTGAAAYRAAIQNNWIGGSAPAGFSIVTVIPSTTWTKNTLTWVADSSVAYFLLDYIGTGANESYYIDGVILTLGSTSYNYADGNSAGWGWNGAVNNSISTGIPL